MEQIKKITGLIALTVGTVVGFLAASQPVWAQYYSQGESNKSISIDKKIRPINSDKYVDNIDKDSKTFVEGDSLDFSVLVENTGNQDLFSLNVKDFLPPYQNIVFNPGVYDQNGARIDWTIDKLGVGESKVFTIRTRIGAVSNQLPWMITNKACVDGDNVSDCDQASFFVVSKQVPSTGNEAILIQSLMGVSGAALALGLRRLARGY